MTCTQRLTEELRARGFRMTSQRLAILQALHDGGHLSPAQIYERVHQTGLTETTVYRTLEFLAGNDIVHPAQNSGGHLTYELAGHEHHHLICRSCGAQVEIDHALIQELYGQLEVESGYQLSTSHLTLFGLCPECKPK